MNPAPEGVRDHTLVNAKVHRHNFEWTDSDRGAVFAVSGRTCIQRNCRTELVASSKLSNIHCYVGLDGY